LLEQKLKNALDDFDRLEKDIESLSKGMQNQTELDLVKSDMRMQLIKTKMQVQGKIKDLSKEIRDTNKYIDQFNRTHNYGERLGDMLEVLVTSVYELVFPFVGTDHKTETKEAFDSAWKKLARDFGVPASKIMG
jgi:chromosome segregation ATPase